VEIRVFSQVVLVLNLLWFGAGACYFGLTPLAAARLLVHRSARGSPLFQTLAASLPFLGGMNLALSVFSALLLLCGAMFPRPEQRALFAVVFVVGHGSQFAANVRVEARKRWRGEELWPVRSGTMSFIFLTDFVLMAANAVVCAGWLLA
jgi:hypothetical protein